VCSNYRGKNGVMLRKIKKILEKSLYTKLAPFYDIASWLVSKGKWTKWQSYSIDKLKGRKILDIGCGTGSLLFQIDKSGYLTFGIDKSKDMLDVCRKKAFRNSKKINIVQADIINLPIKNEQIDTVILTFPTNVILLLPLYDEVFRILTLKGRLIIVDYPYFHKKTVFNFIFNLLASVGKRDINNIQQKIIDSGFKPMIEEVRDEDSIVKLIVLDK
jgi:ubiquinone/menaquinone biosynthesis C-methylase UbiE